MYHFKVLLVVLGMVIVIAGCESRETLQSSHGPPQSSNDEVPPNSKEPAITLSFPEVKSGANHSPAKSQIPESLSFVDVGKDMGLIYDWPMQPRPMTALDAFGAGCAAFDADNDGWMDILLLASPFPMLFRNEGGRGFTDVTAEAQLNSLSGHWTGCAIGDYDGDGRLDIVLTGYHQLRLMKNIDGLTFRDETLSIGLDPSNQGYWGASAGFMDLDRDQWLDLVILNYVIYGPESQKYCEYSPGIISGCGPRTYPPERGQIWHNRGGRGFELMPGSNGMNSTHGVSLVIAFSDVNNDGLQDFYIGNDGVEGDLLRNLGDLMFDNVAAETGVATSDNGGAVSSMGADWGDYNRDGHLDLVVTNWQGDSFVLFQNLGHGVFVDNAKQTDLAQISRSRLGFGAKWVDFENDGWLDLFFVNGHVYDNSAEIQSEGVPFRQPMFLLWNDHGKKFVDIVSGLGSEVQRTMVGRGSATIDFNNDGRVDLLAVDYEGPTVLLENRTVSANHWLTIDLRGKTPNTFAYGARLTGAAGDHIWTAEVSPATSYLSSSDPRIHWGLGETTNLESLEIRWPSGDSQVLTDVAADQILRIHQDQTESTD